MLVARHDRLLALMATFQFAALKSVELHGIEYRILARLDTTRVVFVLDVASPIHPLEISCAFPLPFDTEDILLQTNPVYWNQDIVS